MFIASILEGQPVIISRDTEIRKRTGKYMLFTGVEVTSLDTSLPCNNSRKLTHRLKQASKFQRGGQRYDCFLGYKAYIGKVLH